MLISRREMLKRTTLAAGVGALSPMLLNLQAQASGKASLLPKRFVFLSRSNGLRPYGIDPVGIKDRIAKAIAKFEHVIAIPTYDSISLARRTLIIDCCWEQLV